MQIDDAKLNNALTVVRNLIDYTIDDDNYVQYLDDQILEVEEELKHLQTTLASLLMERSVAIRMQEVEKLIEEMQFFINHGERHIDIVDNPDIQ